MGHGPPKPLCGSAPGHVSIRQSVTMVVQKARAMLVEFQVANHVIALPRMEMTDSWTLPTAPNYKMNVDGVY